VATELVPFTATVPDSIRAVSPDLYEFLRQMLVDTRKDSLRTQLGGSTLSVDVMQAVDSTPRYTLGATGTFYHETYGIFTATYVRYQDSVTAAQPVGYAPNMARFDWTVTRDSLRSIDGVPRGFPAADAQAGQFGWIVQSGVNLAPIPLKAAAGDYLSWSTVGLVLGAARPVGQVYASADSIAIGALFIDCKGSGAAAQASRPGDVTIIDTPTDYLYQFEKKLEQIDRDSRRAVSILFRQVASITADGASVVETQRLNAMAQFANLANSAAGRAIGASESTIISLNATNELERSARVWRDEAGFYSESASSARNEAQLSSNDASVAAIASVESARQASVSATDAGTAAQASESSALRAEAAVGGNGLATNFEQEPKYFGGQGAPNAGPPVQATYVQDGANRVVRNTLSNGYGFVERIAKQPVKVGDKLKFTMQAKADVNDGYQAAMRVTYYKVGEPLGEYVTLQETSAALTSAWQTFTFVFTVPDIGVAVIARPAIVLNYPVNRGGTVARLMDLENVTESERARVSAEAALTSRNQASAFASDSQGYANTSRTEADRSAARAGDAAVSASQSDTRATAAGVSAYNSEVYANTSRGYRDESMGYRDGASAQATSAFNSATSADASKASANESKILSAQYRDESQGYRNQAGGFATNANNSAVSADASKVSANESKVLAAGYSGDALNYRNQSNAILEENRTISASQDGKLQVYWGIVASAGPNRASIELRASAGVPGGYTGFDITGNVRIYGNLLVTGTVNTLQLAANSVTNAMGARADNFTIAANDSGEKYLCVQYQADTTGTMRIDYNYFLVQPTNPNGGPPPLSIQLQRVNADGGVTVLATPGTNTGSGFFLDTPGVQLGVTYRFMVKHQYTGNGAAPSTNIVSMQLFTLGLKR
jgi:hypothetical protein